MTPTPGLDVGVARQAELPRVGELVADAYVAGGFVDAGNPYLRQVRDATARWTQAELVVARLDGVVVGSVTFCLAGTPWAEIARPGEAELRMLAVDASATGRGVGRALVRESLRRGSQQGVRATVISTVPAMQRAQRLYASMGFVRTPERDWEPRPGLRLLTYQRPRAT